MNRMIGKEFDCIKQTLIKAQKEHNILDLIKKKKVNIGTFYFVVFILKADYDNCKLNNSSVMYNICDTKKDFLTKEEFDILKGFLE